MSVIGNQITPLVPNIFELAAAAWSKPAHPKSPAFKWIRVNAAAPLGTFFAASACLTLADLDPWEKEPRIIELRDLILSAEGQPGLPPRAAITCLSEEDVGKLCQALMESGKIQLPSGYELRLMSEAEWMAVKSALAHTSLPGLDDMNTQEADRLTENWAQRGHAHATCVLRSPGGSSRIASSVGLDKAARGRCRLVVAPMTT